MVVVGGSHVLSQALPSPPCPQRLALAVEALACQDLESCRPLGRYICAWRRGQDVEPPSGRGELPVRVISGALPCLQ